MTFTVDMDYYDMQTLWGYCKVAVDKFREISPDNPVYDFVQQEADKLEKIMGALEKSMDDEFTWYDHAQSWTEEV